MSIDGSSGGGPAIGRCAECGSSLAHDQRYCLACGGRRGPLPAVAARLIGGGPPPAAAVPDDPGERGFAMPPPRAAALAVMAVLAFGVVVGSLPGPAALGSASAPVLVALAQPAPAPPAPTPEPTPAPRRRVVHRPAPAVATPAPSPAPTAVPARATPAPTPEPPPPAPALPAIQHVFLIVLSDHGYDEAFGSDSPAPYLSGTLRKQGELIPNYYAVANSPLANEVALISGQGPTAQIAAGCPQYADIAPGTVAADGQVTGDGCVYPAPAQTLGDQLTASGATWKAYVEDMGNGPAGSPTTCRHPVLGSPDPDQIARPGDAFVTWRDPFVYFHSAIDAPTCGEHLVGLDQLATDLGAPATTPSFSLIVPDRCHDGSADPCAPDQPAGLSAADAFLRTALPQIQHSAAYRSGGLIAITFDRAPQTGPTPDSSSCCDQPIFPGLPAVSPTPTPTPALTSTATPTPTPVPPATPIGGGKVGVLLLSRYVKPGSLNGLGTYNHFSMLRSIEDLFGLDHLGYAADPALSAFDRVVYNASSPRSG